VIVRARRFLQVLLAWTPFADPCSATARALDSTVADVAHTVLVGDVPLAATVLGFFPHLQVRLLPRNGPRNDLARY
jgi:hypothetical protein